MPKRLFRVVLPVFLLVAGCATQPAVPPQQPPQRVQPLKIGLALGGGAARGFAHVGVIKTLEAQGIDVQIVAGTSAGSVVGALYAGGYGGFDLQKIAFGMEADAVGDWTLPDRGFIKGELLQDFINASLKNRPIEHLNKTFGAVATDLKSGEETVFRRGNTGMAVRASSSVPGVFQPVGIGGHEYVDGGLTSPVPVKAAREMGADFVIAVDISSKPKYGKVNDTKGILLQTFSIMGQSISQYELAQADVVIRPDTGKFGPADFEHKNQAIMEGERAALAAMPTIRSLLARRGIGR